MTRKELAIAAAKRTEITHATAEKLVDAFLDVTTEALRLGQKIELRGFGTFKVKDTPARMGRNPKTGESVQIPAKKKVSFKPSKDMGV